MTDTACWYCMYSTSQWTSTVRHTWFLLCPGVPMSQQQLKTSQKSTVITIRTAMQNSPESELCKIPVCAESPFYTSCLRFSLSDSSGNVRCFFLPDRKYGGHIMQRVSYSLLRSHPPTVINQRGCDSNCKHQLSPLCGK